MDNRAQLGLLDGEPVPPALSTQPLFRTEEILLFEDFLDNLATENEFLFHSNVPASLSWDGFSTSKNSAFDVMKHSGLQFGSDTHFSKTDGYVATHKFVPPGYGRVHPQSSAQRSQRSSASSRRPSMPPEVAALNLGTSDLHQSPLHTRHSSNSDIVPLGSYNFGDLSDRLPKPYPMSYAPTSAGPQPMPMFLDGHGGSTTQPGSMPIPYPPDVRYSSAHVASVSATQGGDRSALSMHKPGPGQALRSDPHTHAPNPTYTKAVREGREESEESVARLATHKKIKLEEGVGKQPLSAAQKRQNHISSEQRRRNLIKEGFSDLSILVPNVSGNASKSTILHEAIGHIKLNVSRNQQLRARISVLKDQLQIR